jgi:predicted dehydrogenase
MPQKVRVGIVGCGAISGAYLKMIANFPIIQVVALADLIRQRSEGRATEFGLNVKVCTTEEMMKDKSIECVLNLTWPKAHVPVALQAVRAGKHTISEKPFGISVAEGKKLLAAARGKAVLVGCAPDTVLGAGIQTARKAIDDGMIGRPVSFTAFMMGRGVETWHPNPPFYYEPGGGPMFDMGPYYLTALLNLLGPIKRVCGFASIAIPQRTITHKKKDGTPGPMYGDQITVTTPDHICGVIEFENGCVGSIVTSFATHFGNYDGKQPITIHGTDGSLKVPDPNGFDGPVHVRRPGQADWVEVPHAFVEGYGRAVGLADMCYAIRTGRRHRCHSDQAFVVLECMQGFLDSSTKGKTVCPTVKYERPAPMPAHLPFGALDE